ncbi:MAG: LysM peptidoglycan-binding domain-containing protein [Sedimentisphaeraceae bacterium JB056]
MRKDFKFGLMAGSFFAAVFLVFYLFTGKNNSPVQEDPDRAVSRLESDSQTVNQTQNISPVVPLRTQEHGYLPEGQSDFIERLEKQAKETSRPQIENIETAKTEVKVESKPVQKSNEVRTYTVVSGDTLSGISKRFYGTTSKWQKILEANRSTLKNPAGLKPGMELIIPE